MTFKKIDAKQTTTASAKPGPDTKKKGLKKIGGLSRISLKPK
jgi:hypothetical protein